MKANKLQRRSSLKKEKPERTNNMKYTQSLKREENNFISKVQSNLQTHWNVNHLFYKNSFKKKSLNN